MGNQKRIKNQLNKIYDPDYDITLHCAQDNLNIDQCLIANLSKLGKKLICTKNKRPFIRVTSTIESKLIVNDFFDVSWNDCITDKKPIKYYLDFAFNCKYPRTIDAYLYRNESNQALLFESIVYPDHSVSLKDTITLHKIKTYLQNRHPDYFHHGEKGLIIGHEIELKTKKWQMTRVYDGDDDNTLLP